MTITYDSATEYRVAPGDHDPENSEPPRKRRRVSLTQVFGELMVTAGVILLLFAFYEAYWTNVEAGQRQAKANEALESAWNNTTDAGRVNPRTQKTLEMGAAFARIHVPAFGSDWQFAILNGVDDETLFSGPGHYPETQGPGTAGNFALAGHRVGKGAPFNDLGSLNVCDAVVVETATQWITYRVLPMSTDGASRASEATCFSPEQSQRIAEGDYSAVQGRHITLPNDVGVLDPIPNSGAQPVGPNLEGLLTLTTCHPQFSNAERMIVHAMRTDVQSKTAGQLPTAMQEA